MNDIIILTDYKGQFGSKSNSIPYRGGMNKEFLKGSFLAKGFNILYIQFSQVIQYEVRFWEGKLVIYTSSEDVGYSYKSFIEDIIYYLELNRAKVIPQFKYLKANNNKVFMELLRKSMTNKFSLGLESEVFGCLEETKSFIARKKTPLVFKNASGAMSEGVGIGYNEKDLIAKLKVVSSTPSLFEDFKDFFRPFRYKGYNKESRYRRKFILQQFIPSLNGDYKVLIFSNKYFVLERRTRKNDFRASGSGILNYTKDLPEGLLKFASDFFKELNVPNASLDIAFNSNDFFLIEFQCIYFGSYTLTHSDFFWQLRDDHFELIESKSQLESEYVDSIVNYIKKL
jgi:hypothetical protein